MTCTSENDRNRCATINFFYPDNISLGTFIRKEPLVFLLFFFVGSHDIAILKRPVKLDDILYLEIIFFSSIYWTPSFQLCLFNGSYWYHDMVRKAQYFRNYSNNNFSFLDTTLPSTKPCQVSLRFLKCNVELNIEQEVQ